LADKPVEASKGMRQSMGVKADWSMTIYDFERYNILLKVADELAVRVRLFDSSSIRDYYSVLRQLYINWRPLMDETMKTEFDKSFNDARNDIFRLKEFESTEIIEVGESDLKMHVPIDLEQIHLELLEFKQLKGLGVPTRLELTEEQKLKRAMA